jgi:hypothetical protein
MQVRILLEQTVAAQPHAYFPGCLKIKSAKLVSQMRTAALGKTMTGTSADSTERRKWQRLPVAIPVFVRGIDDAGKPFLEFTTALNISAGGALLIIRHDSLSEEAELSIEIPAAPMTQENSRRNLDGQLVRVRSLLGWCVGALRFTRPLLEKEHARPNK